MSTQTLGLSDALHRYLLEVSVREDDVARALRARTAQLPEAVMQISPEQGQFFALLLQLLGAERAVEVGTFTGYSALCIARALGPGGRLVCLDTSAEWTAIAREHWRRAGVDDRIELLLAPAAQSLDGMLEAGEAGAYDFGFIDADKQGYPLYYERVLALLRPGGLVAVDNTLWSGRVADAADDDASTRAIRDFNRMAAADARVQLSLVPIGDGLTLARKL